MILIHHFSLPFWHIYIFWWWEGYENKNKYMCLEKSNIFKVHNIIQLNNKQPKKTRQRLIHIETTDIRILDFGQKCLVVWLKQYSTFPIIVQLEIHHFIQVWFNLILIYCWQNSSLLKTVYPDFFIYDARY